MKTACVAVVVGQLSPEVKSNVLYCCTIALLEAKKFFLQKVGPNAGIEPGSFQQKRRERYRCATSTSPATTFLIIGICRTYIIKNMRSITCRAPSTPYSTRSTVRSALSARFSFGLEGARLLFFPYSYITIVLFYGEYVVLYFSY